ncbi:MAG: FAD-dependent oxidoreductase, partial [Candidatus Micrarchaeia archaeon]
MQDSYDVVIVGGGITGASLLYMLSRYTDAKRILLLEKFDSFAALNSNSNNNAQTLHFGDIETNYSLEKSRETKEEAEIVLKYLSMLPKKEYDSITKRCGKMVLGVGEEEIAQLDKIYDSGLKHIFPGLKKIGPNEIAKLEPNVMK